INYTSLSPIFTLSLHDALPISPTEVRSELNVGSDVRLVSFVGRLVAGKGILPLVEAMAQLHRSRPGGWKLVIVGEGPLSGSLARSEEHTSELQSRGHLVCRLLL